MARPRRRQWCCRHRQLPRSPGRASRSAIVCGFPAGGLTDIFARAEYVLEEVGYLKAKSREATLVKLRRLMIELRLTNSDAKILGGVLAQIEWKLKQMTN